jgi:predicted ATP-dependent endonuclease of OLD family
MIIKKLKLQNFKKFSAPHVFEFNDDINIIVGDNESGKSTLLEAIELCLNLTYRGKPLSQELSTDLFNTECIAQYINGNKAQDSLPEILIECFLDGDPELRGNNNSLSEDAEGIFLRIYFDTEMAGPYADFIEGSSKVTTIPVEFYKYEWFSFAWKSLTTNKKKATCLTVDSTRLHPTYGRTRYINSILNSSIERSDRSKLNLNYRQQRATFETRPDVKSINDSLDIDNTITEKSLKITADVASAPTWESGLQLSVNDVTFDQIGKGEQSQIQIKLALRNKGGDVDIVLLEEPENHLSHMNLVRLLSYIEKKNHAKQVFLTTHSSYVLNKLSIDKLCLLSDGYIRLKDIDPRTVKTVKRLPGYDTLRHVHRL